jgi:uncharacterized membrane protein
MASAIRTLAKARRNFSGNGPTMHDRDPRESSTRLKMTALGFVFLWFAIGGIAHFALTDTEMRIVPPYIPWPRATVLVSGVFELLGAIGLLLRRTRRAAGVGLFALTLAVTPANVYMLERADLFAIPLWILIARLPLQLVLLSIIWWACDASHVMRRLL